MSLDPGMPPAQVSADSAQPDPVDPAYQSSSIGAQDVWFYMADAESQDRPSEEAVAETIAADNSRQSTLAFHLFKKPKSTRIRFRREKNEWRTWLNRIGGISRPMREHLSKEHPATYSQKCNEQGVGVRAGARSFSVPPAGAQSEEAETSTGSTSNSITQPAKPQTPQREPPPHIQRALPPPPPQQQQPTQSYPQPPYPRPHHHTHWEPERRKSALELAQEAVDVASRPRSAETIEELRAELEQVRAQRDHELNARRLLEQELYRMREAARARDQELVKVSHLISASLQALAGGAVSGPPAGVPPVPFGVPIPGPHPHPQVVYPYPYPYPYPYNPA
ncbi:hypothetical protein FRC10_010786 [Ceratobasidium sp. 414]|nr:hypothetical protein FRC10_010786 [Ceratobasidium sp. 414]